MPNWCITNYTMVGDKKQLRSLYGKIKRLEKRKESLVPNGFGKNWLGNLVKRLGKSPSNVWCRGEWMNAELKTIDGETVLNFDTSTAWARCEEVELLLGEVFPDTYLFFMEEEFGNQIFQTNDSEKKYFKETVVIDTEADGTEYFTEEDAIKHLSEKTGRELTNWAEAEQAVEDFNDLLDDSSEEKKIYLYKAELV